MKKLLLLSALLLTVLSFGQVPQGISYQAIALNGSGNPVVSSNVRVRLSVLDITSTGTVLYSETQLKTTNAQGLFNLVIGQGTLVSGAFNTINWGVNSKFLKVEMDATGGTTYVLVGTTQLLSVPYALAADSLVTSAGEGITLVSPNGTPYQLTVNDNGELSLPTSSQGSNAATDLYLYGTFNSWNASAALHLGNYVFGGFVGYKYLTSGTQIKLLAAQNANVVYGFSGGSTGNLVVNGSPYTVPSNGFYRITSDGSSYEIKSINVVLNQNYTVNTTMQYNTSGNYFYGNSDYGEIRFTIDGQNYGDNLADGSVEYDGATIMAIQNTDYQYRLTIDFDGNINYTVSAPLPGNCYLFGAFQSWNPATAIQMSNLSPGIYQINYNFTAATTIKFATQLNWNNSYGGTAGTLVLSGNDIPVTIGSHTIMVNFGTMTYTIN